jgi:hypothetical protein
LLCNPFYAGFVPHKGKLYKGRHDQLVSEALFEQVQAVLKSHNKAGERDRKHLHYLKGTVRCGHCDQRLTYSRNKGNGGTYEYFVCAPGMKGDCEGGYRRVETIEGLIEDHYRTIKLSPEEHERVSCVIEQRLARHTTISQQELDRCGSVLSGLKEQEKKLLDKHWIELDKDQRVYARSQLASPFNDLRSVREEITAFEQTKASNPAVGSEALVVGSITDEMVGETGSSWLSQAIFGASAAILRPSRPSLCRRWTCAPAASTLASALFVMVVIAFDQALELAEFDLVVLRAATVHEVIQNVVRSSSHELDGQVLEHIPLRAGVGKQEYGAYVDALYVRPKELSELLHGIVELTTRPASFFVSDAVPFVAAILVLDYLEAAVELLDPPFIPIAANAPVLVLALDRNECLRAQKQMIDLTRAVLVTTE